MHLKQREFKCIISGCKYIKNIIRVFVIRVVKKKE